MFKIPSKEDQNIALEGYQELVKTQSRDGKPYILSLEAGPANEDARSQGFTFVAKSVFKNLEDFWYYDKECAAHQKFKANLVEKKVKVEGMMMVYYTPALSNLL